MSSVIKFYNNTQTPINLRKVWEPGAPKLTLNPGQFIEGPYEYLSTMPFLSQIMDYDDISSEIPTFANSIVGSYEQYYTEETKSETSLVFGNKDEESEEDEPDVKVGEIVVAPSNKFSVETFDPKTAKWATITIDALLELCKYKNIDLSSAQSLKGAAKRFELVKLVKAAYN